MGWLIEIGEVVVERDGDEWQLTVRAEEGRANSRAPSYEAWRSTMQDAGLAGWWQHKTEGCGSDGRVFALDLGDVIVVQGALVQARRWLRTELVDRHVERLEWLAAQVAWAVRECERPGMRVA